MPAIADGVVGRDQPRPHGGTARGRVQVQRLPFGRKAAARVSAWNIGPPSPLVA